LKCQNNLKQIGLAMHMYNDTNNRLPAGWGTSTSIKPSPGWSWAVLILPNVEQQNLYYLLNPDLITPGAAALTASTQTALPIYRCPSDPGQQTDAVLGSFGMSNYVCNREVLGPDVNNNPTNLSIQTIPDGSSNTILVGERDSVRNIGAVYVRASQTSASF